MKKKAMLLLVLLALMLSLAGTAIAAGPLSGYEVVTSPPLAFNDTGYGGWSCPAGKVAVGGGFVGNTFPVSVSAPGTPGSVWPHYTFGAAEYGWVIQNGGTAQSITVYVVCADAPSGYEVVTSSALNFSDTGWAGWSCPTGKVVTGGGFNLSAGAVETSAPGTPGSVWPHYTFGAAEYGWVARGAADGISSPDSRVYAVCADEPTGYGVIESSPLNYSDTGWGGWSVPVGKVVLGGGFRLSAGSAAASAPATPGSVWPHWTFGAAEYGWVVQGAADGLSSPGSKVYAIYADAPPPPDPIDATTTDDLFCTGETTVVNIDLNDVVDMYGYQFEVEYDDTLVSAGGAFVNSWFDTQDPAKRPWNAACGGGVCQFSVSHSDEGDPDTPSVTTSVTGSGPVATITLTGVAPGTFTMLVKDTIVSDIDANPTYLPNDTLNLTVCGYTDVSGVIEMQGRGAAGAGTWPPTSGTVTLTDLGGDFPPVSTTFDATGAWQILQVPALPGPGGSNYQFVAEHDLYLASQGTKTLLPGPATVVATTRLLGGDANNDATAVLGIDVSDLACIGGAFGTSNVGVPGDPPTVSDCGGLGSADITADGTVNILDLVLPGGNFGKFSPQLTWTP